MEKDYWDLIRQGDEKAFNELYNTYADALYGYGMKIAQNQEMVEDAIQTVFIAIFEKRNVISRPNSIGAYLFTALKNAILCELRKPQLSLISYEDGLSEAGDNNNYDFQLEIDPLSKSDLDEEELCRQETLQQLLQNLNSRHREIIYLRYYKGMSAEEVAEVMGTNRQRIHNITAKVIKRLRDSNMWNKALIALILAVLN